MTEETPIDTSAMITDGSQMCLTDNLGSKKFGDVFRCTWPHRYNLLAAVQKARHWNGESTNEADQGTACEALLGHRIDDRVERVRDLQVVGQVRFVHWQVAEDDRLPRR